MVKVRVRRKKRMLPPSRTQPIEDATYFERVMRLHFRSANDTRRSRAKSYWNAVIYGVVMLFLLFLFGVFGDLP